MKGGGGEGRINWRQLDVSVEEELKVQTYLIKAGEHKICRQILVTADICRTKLCALAGHRCHSLVKIPSRNWFKIG